MPDADTTFRGLLAYPITPLLPDGAPDLDGVARLVARAGRGRMPSPSWRPPAPG